MQSFGQLEAAVMQRLWDQQSPVAVREVLEDFQMDRSIAYTTVMTVMDNLFQKGFLTREMQGRAYRYRPVRTREQHTADLMEQALSNGGDSAATLLHFVEQIPANEVEQLRRVLSDLKPLP
ncbi:BlaI/MecI/CopY family transcriptional regulator [soil metagenome]